MSTAANIFITQTDEIIVVARRLASIGVVVYGHECNCTHFGSWSIVAGTDSERFQFQWEGRGFTFIIAQGVLVAGRREWQPIRTLNLHQPEALSATEDFLQERFMPSKQEQLKGVASR